MKNTVFQELLKPLTKELMNECIIRFRSDYDCERFTTYDHLLTMIYAHLTEIKSLRTLEVAINSRGIGLKGEVKRSTLSDANNRRPFTCFFWIAEQLMLLLPRQLRKGLNKFIKIIDSSPIQLRSKGYEWTEEFSTHHCQGLKLHIEYDFQEGSPAKFAISHPNLNDVTMAKSWLIQANTVYIFDKGYYDFNWWWKIHQNKAFFVTRLKKNVAIVKQSEKERVNEVILEDGLFKFKNKNPRGGKANLYQENLRRISIAREGKNPLILVTNLLDYPAEMIAELYKSRWRIELFFKWIKQNLKLKKFLGKSANAVKIQIAAALIAYLLVQLFKNGSSDSRRLQLVLVWIRHNLNTVWRKVIYHSPPLYPFSLEKGGW